MSKARRNHAALAILRADLGETSRCDMPELATAVLLLPVTQGRVLSMLTWDVDRPPLQVLHAASDWHTLRDLLCYGDIPISSVARRLDLGRATIHEHKTRAIIAVVALLSARRNGPGRPATEQITP